MNFHSRYGTFRDTRLGRCKVHYKAMCKCGIKLFYLSGMWREVRDGVLMVTVLAEIYFFFWALKYVIQ